MADQINLRIPDELRTPIDEAAKQQDCTPQAVILKVLAKHFKTPVTVPVRGRPWPKKVAE